MYCISKFLDPSMDSFDEFIARIGLSLFSPEHSLPPKCPDDGYSQLTSELHELYGRKTINCDQVIQTNSTDLNEGIESENSLINFDARLLLTNIESSMTESGDSSGTWDTVASPNDTGISMTMIEVPSKPLTTTIEKVTVGHDKPGNFIDESTRSQPVVTRKLCLNDYRHSIERRNLGKALFDAQVVRKREAEQPKALTPVKKANTRRGKWTDARRKKKNLRYRANLKARRSNGNDPVILRRNLLKLKQKTKRLMGSHFKLVKETTRALVKDKERTGGKEMSEKREISMGFQDKAMQFAGRFHSIGQQLQGRNPDAKLTLQELKNLSAKLYFN
jgi:hypothetical protein